MAAVYLIAGPHSNDLGGGSSPLAAYATGPVAHFVPDAAPAPVPNLEFRDGAGKLVHLADFRGKLLLLNLWATWCTPCREEMPSLDGLQGAIGSDKFQVLALSVDQNGLELARAFLKEVKADHIALYNDPTARANFLMKGYGLPTTVLVSPDGLELGRIVGPAEWNTPEAKALIAAALKLPSGH
ncbi:MAG TPA: TlpA disulfide reductase family protein [Parvibaculum sp.]